MGYDKPTFSFMMCVYNDTSLLQRAIESLQRQAYSNWELIILDNSDRNDTAWEMIQNITLEDDRIKGYKSEQNVGWPKGASICLEHVTGEYTTFLAADDMIYDEALEILYKNIQAERPDVIWVGNSFLVYSKEKEGTFLLDGKVPEYAVYGEENRSQVIVDIMKNLYYNSFFHYMRVDFLRAHKIDFFEPYYADCAGMTKVLAVAKKMVVSDFPIYALTKNTSQTVGTYTWDSYDFIFAKQWKIIKEVFVKESYTDIGVCYAANRILQNLIGNVGTLCKMKCRDKYMNPLHKSTAEVIGQLEEILKNPFVLEMMILTGEERSRKRLFRELRKLNQEDAKECIQKSWLQPLFALLWNAEASDDEQLNLLCDWLLQKENICCIGFDYFIELFESASDETVVLLRDKLEQVMEKYKAYLSWLDTNVWLRQVIA